MVIIFNKNSNISEIREALAKLKKPCCSSAKNEFDARKISGSLKFEEDGLDIQKKLRAEWD